MDIREIGKNLIVGEVKGNRVFVINKNLTPCDCENIFIKEEDVNWLYLAVRNYTDFFSIGNNISIKKNYYGRRAGRCMKGYEREFLETLKKAIL